MISNHAVPGQYPHILPGITMMPEDFPRKLAVRAPGGLALSWTKTWW